MCGDALLVAPIVREGGEVDIALPLGRAVQHTGEINAEHPLEMLWIFGRPAQVLDGFRQVCVEEDRGGVFTVRAMLNVDAQVFGDASAVNVLPL